MSAVRDIAKQIEERASLLSEELARLRQAYRALTGQPLPRVEHRPVGQVDTRLPVPNPPTTTQADTHDGLLAEDDPTPIRLPGQRPAESVRVEVAALFNASSPDRDWSYDEILTHWESEGVVFDVVNLRDALRSAIFQLQKDDAIERAGRGRYRKKVFPVHEGGLS